MNDPEKLAQRMARRLGWFDSVVAVVLGGSWARGTARPNSGIDLGLLLLPQPPALSWLAARQEQRRQQGVGEAPAPARHVFFEIERAGGVPRLS